MKFGESITIDDRAKLEAVKIKGKKLHPGQIKDQIIPYVESNPGASAKQIVKNLKLSREKVYSALYVYGRKGYILSKRLDGKNRYYANNYLLSDKKHQKPENPILPREVLGEFMPTPRLNAKTLKTSAMEYVWDTGNDSLHEFVKWFEERKVD